MMRAWGRVLALSGLAAVPLGAQTPAPPPHHETVVVTGTAAPETVGNVGRAVTVLTREDLERLPVTAVSDVLRLIASVDVRARGPKGVQSDFSIRGAGFGQVLVLVDGTRLNDAQSGHHNGDLPVAVEDIERVEVLRGAGASLHGADAVGGAINVITRRPAARWAWQLAGGGHRLLEAGGSIGFERPGAGAHVVAGEWLRASAFMPARDHDVRLARYAAHVGRGTTWSLAHLDKAFGAAGFYGPAPSREWTEQTLARVEQRVGSPGGWQVRADSSYRRHGDRFVYDERTPALSDNRHRTHAVTGHVRGSRSIGASTQVSLGGGGGGDWIRSSNLGDHTFSRASVFAEARQALGPRVLLHPGLRVDAYSRFGTAWSPALALSGWTSDRIRWRASTGRAFRVPTFTELYYTDPNHRASDTLAPETGWSLDGGGDLFAGRWTTGVTVFRRWENRVIDWVRATPLERWQTTNVRNVRTGGLEVSLRGRLPHGVHAGVEYVWLATEAPALGVLSKYVLDYARHAVAASGSAEWRGFIVGARAEAKRRSDGRRHTAMDLRVGRRAGRVDVYVDASNLFDAHYEEIRGVVMPGRWLKAGIKVR